MLEQKDIQKSPLSLPQTILVSILNVCKQNRVPEVQRSKWHRFHFEISLFPIGYRSTGLFNREIKGKYENILCYSYQTIISTPTKLFSMDKLTHTYNISNEKKIACGELKISSVEKTSNFLDRFLFQKFWVNLRQRRGMRMKSSSNKV